MTRALTGNSRHNQRRLIAGRAGDTHHQACRAHKTVAGTHDTCSQPAAAARVVLVRAVVLAGGIRRSHNMPRINVSRDDSTHRVESSVRVWARDAPSSGLRQQGRDKYFNLL